MTPVTTKFKQTLPQSSFLTIVSYHAEPASLLIQQAVSHATAFLFPTIHYYMERSVYQYVPTLHMCRIPAVYFAIQPALLAPWLLPTVLLVV